MNNKETNNNKTTSEELKALETAKRNSGSRPGFISNSIIQKRNGGVRHQFQDSIGGDSSNYR